MLDEKYQSAYMLLKSVSWRHPVICTRGSPCEATDLAGFCQFCPSEMHPHPMGPQRTKSFKFSTLLANYTEEVAETCSQEKGMSVDYPRRRLLRLRHHFCGPSRDMVSSLVLVRFDPPYL